MTLDEKLRVLRKEVGRHWEGPTGSKRCGCKYDLRRCYVAIAETYDRLFGRSLLRKISETPPSRQGRSEAQQRLRAILAELRELERDLSDPVSVKKSHKRRR